MSSCFLLYWILFHIYLVSSEWNLSTGHLLRCLRVTLNPSSSVRLCRPFFGRMETDNIDEGKERSDNRGIEALGLGSVGLAQGLNLHLLSGHLGFLIVQVDC